MAERLNEFPLKALEVNVSCPNVDSPLLLDTEVVVEICEKVYKASRHPIILKISAAHDHQAIVEKLFYIVEAIAINSVPWEIAFPNKKSPLEKFGKGGVSGKSAQAVNWRVVQEIARLNKISVIGPSVWQKGDMEVLRIIGAKAVSFGAVLSWHPIRTRSLIHNDKKRQ